MAKPSIFSRDYEKRMRKRRIRITLIVLVIIGVVFSLLFKFKIQNIDFGNLKDRIQAWVDTGKPEEELNDSSEEAIEESDNTESEVKVPEKLMMDLNVSEGVVVKAEYIEENGEKKFVNIEPVDGITYDISPSGKQILITDSSQNLKLFNVDGTEKDVTKVSYISGAGTTFTKEQTLLGTPEYLWHSQVRFVDETRIAYISQLPYFGSSATNKYVWLADVTNAPEQMTERVIWELKATDIAFGELVPEKGLQVIENGVTFYLNGDGVVSQ